MALLLIRHGETDFNTTRVVQFPDTPLGTRGLAQAEHLGQNLASRSIGRILTSDYARARATADALVKHTGAPLVVVESLRERNFGDIRGKPYDELGDLDIFAADFCPAGGESWTVFNARVDLAWDAVTAQVRDCDGDLAIVTHGLVLRSLFERRLDCTEHRLDENIVVANTSVTIVDNRAPWRIIELASTAHLPEDVGDVAPV